MANEIMGHVTFLLQTDQPVLESMHRFAPMPEVRAGVLAYWRGNIDALLPHAVDADQRADLETAIRKLDLLAAI